MKKMDNVYNVIKTVFPVQINPIFAKNVRTLIHRTSKMVVP